MLTTERRQYILEALASKSVVQLTTIANELQVSESTIRRDFDYLEERGELERVHGGARQVSQRFKEDSLNEKRQVNTSAKQIIAKRASEVVQDGDIIYLDSGTTTIEMVPHLINKNILVVTNGLEVAMTLLKNQVNSILLGGKLKHSTGAIIGTITQNQLLRYNFDRVFLGINGIDEKAGYTTPDIEEADLKKLALKQGKQVYILADDSKVEKISFAHVANLDQATLITNDLHPAFEEKVHVLKETNE